MKHLYISISALAISLIFTILFQSCGSDTVTNTGNNTPLDTSTFTYPFGIGSSWNYHRTYSVTDIRPDSIRHYFTNYPINGTGTITIKGDTIINGLTMRGFHDVYSDPSQNFTSDRYYSNNNEALICNAYRNGGGSNMPDNFEAGITFKKGNLVFKKLSWLDNSFSYNNINNPDTLIFLNPPDTCLKYPIITNFQWTYVSNGVVTITKKYLDFENFMVNGVNVTVIKTQLNYSYPGLNVHNYYSKFGELSKELVGNDWEISNEFGQTIGTADFNDNYIVTSYNIVNP